MNYVARYIGNFNGFPYYRDQYRNIYCKFDNGEIAYCGTQHGSESIESKLEPSYPVEDIIIHN